MHYFLFIYLFQKNSSSGRKSADLSKRTRLTPTKVKAFSFETRDKERYTKKEERIKNYKLNEEKVCLHHSFIFSLPLFPPTQNSSIFFTIIENNFVNFALIDILLDFYLLFYFYWEFQLWNICRNWISNSAQTTKYTFT